ncbi:unnamed protein product, partial [Brenthis ino]
MAIQTFIFFDLETTGLPGQEKNQTKITELTFLAVLRRDIERVNNCTLPPISKLSFLFNPRRNIQWEVVKITGLSNDFLCNQPIFKDKIKCINEFLELPKPVCLVAHNGDRFDFKILNTEYADVEASLPDDLLCIDSMKAFREILKNCQSLSPNAITPHNHTQETLDWPELDITPEEWTEIDQLSESFTKLTSTPKKIELKPLKSYALSYLYNFFVKKEPKECHRAEADCFMLLECVLAIKQEFLHWADKNYKYIKEIKPLSRK